MSGRAYLSALSVVLLVAGCGGSHSAGTPSAATAAGASSGTVTASQSTTTTSASGSGSSSGSSARSYGSGSTGGQQSTTHPSGGAGISRGAGTGSGTGSGGGSTNVRVPATFVIGAGGKLNPPSVSSPAFLALELTLVSGDGRAHTILVRTPTPHSLSISAHGRASVLIPGLRAGRYVLDVDGAARGALVIGGEPGP